MFRIRRARQRGAVVEPIDVQRDAGLAAIITAVRRQRRQLRGLARGLGQPRRQQRRPARDLARDFLMRQAAIGGHAQTGPRIGQVALPARLPAPRLALGEGRRCRAFQQIGRHPPLAERRQALGTLAGRPADVLPG
jgi:hypothetical protein